jgi:hypothetical protein
VRHRRLRSLLLSDLLGAGLLTLLACSLYFPLFFFNVAWFLRIVCFVESIGACRTRKCVDSTATCVLLTFTLSGAWLML